MDILSYISQGGFIIYILIFFNIIGFSIIIYKSIFLFFIYKDKKRYVKKLQNEILTKNIQNDTDKSELLIANFIQKLENGLDTIKIIASISPLLGLLGTIIGIFKAFGSIAINGLDDPALLSSGINIALITTIAGLIVAIPHYITYNYFIRLIDKIELYIKTKVYNL